MKKKIFLFLFLSVSTMVNLRAEILFETITENHREKISSFFSQGFELIDIAFRAEELIYVFQKLPQSKIISEKKVPDFFLKLFTSEEAFLEGISYYQKKNFLAYGISYSRLHGFAVFFVEEFDLEKIQKFEIKKIPFLWENIYSTQNYLTLIRKKIEQNLRPAANLFYEDYIFQAFRKIDLKKENLKEWRLGFYANAKEMHQDMKIMSDQKRKPVSFDMDLKESLMIIFWPE